MQKFNVYSIYDVKSQTYGNIFCLGTDGLACRLLGQIVGFGGNPDYQRYPEDFALYCLGTFDDFSGALVSESPRLICTVQSALHDLQSRGAAVGGLSPLKSQSANDSVSSADAENSSPACDAEDTSLF